MRANVSCEPRPVGYGGRAGRFEYVRTPLARRLLSSDSSRLRRWADPSVSSGVRSRRARADGDLDGIGCVVLDYVEHLASRGLGTDFGRRSSTQRKRRWSRTLPWPNRASQILRATFVAADDEVFGRSASTEETDPTRRRELVGSRSGITGRQLRTTRSCVHPDGLTFAVGESSDSAVTTPIGN